jgi:hypothetical protein
MRTVSERAVAADRLARETRESGLGGSHPVTLHTTMLRLERLNVKAELDRELGAQVGHVFMGFKGGG